MEGRRQTKGRSMGWGGGAIEDGKRERADGKESGRTSEGRRPGGGRTLTRRTEGERQSTQHTSRGKNRLKQNRGERKKQKRESINVMGEVRFGLSSTTAASADPPWRQGRRRGKGKVGYGGKRDRQPNSNSEEEFGKNQSGKGKQ